MQPPLCPTLELKIYLLVLAELDIDLCTNHNHSHLQETSARKVLSCATNSDLQLNKKATLNIAYLRIAEWEAILRCAI